MARFRGSTFKTIYLAIVALSFLGLFFINLLLNKYIAPSIFNEKINRTVSLVASQHENIIYNNNRTLINELINGHVIKNENFFTKYSFNNETDRINLEKKLIKCSFSSRGYCINESTIIIFHGLSVNKNNKSYNYAIELNTLNLKRTDIDTLKLLTQFAFLFLMGLILFAIRRKEKHLVSKIQALSSTIESISNNFNEFSPKKSSNNLDDINTSLGELSLRLKNKIKEIKEYKTIFEKRTTLEQMGLTIAQVSHDLKGPLNEVENFFNSLPTLLKIMNEDEIEEVISSLKERVSRAKFSIDLSLKQTERNKVLDEEVNIYELISNTSMRLNLKVNLNPKGNKSFIVKGSKAQLETVLENLFKNSIEAKNNPRVNLVLSSEEKTVKLLYEDDGPGIKNDDLDRVFEPFMTTKKEGSGFGLSSCKSIIEMHLGNIKALANNSGAKFLIELPKLGNA